MKLLRLSTQRDPDAASLVVRLHPLDRLRVDHPHHSVPSQVLTYRSIDSSTPADGSDVADGIRVVMVVRATKGLGEHVEVDDDVTGLCPLTDVGGLARARWAGDDR